MRKTYTKNVSEPWFTLIKIGKKTREGRLNKGDFKEMKRGDIIKFVNNEFGWDRTFSCEVLSKKVYTSFATYLRGETPEKCLPGIDTIADGVSVYHRYFTREDVRRFGVVSIRVKVIL